MKIINMPHLLLHLPLLLSLGSNSNDNSKMRQIHNSK